MPRITPLGGWNGVPTAPVSGKMWPRLSGRADHPMGRAQAVAVLYIDALKTQMVKRMMGPNAVSAATLAHQVGGGQPTLSQWLRAANRVAAMAPPSEVKKPAPPAGPKK